MPIIVGTSEFFTGKFAYVQPRELSAPFRNGDLVIKFRTIEQVGERRLGWSVLRCQELLSATFFTKKTKMNDSKLGKA